MGNFGRKTAKIWRKFVFAPKFDFFARVIFVIFSEGRNLAGNLNANFGGKIQIEVFPVSGLRSSPNFTGRRSLGTCTRRTNPRSIISNRSKVIEEKPFPEIADFCVEISKNLPRRLATATP